MLPWIVGGGVAILALSKGGIGSSKRTIKLDPAYEPKKEQGFPFAPGVPSVWPVHTNHRKKFVVSYKTINGKIVGNGARRFMARRGGGHHMGCDLYGNNGDPILAMEDGKVVNYYHFFHGAYALIVQHKSGVVVNYGEVKKNSWKEFNISKGSFVRRGQAIARLGVMSGGSTMLHFETYRPGVTHNQRWSGKHPDILNPTKYLLGAAMNVAQPAKSPGSGPEIPLMSGIPQAPQAASAEVPDPSDSVEREEEYERSTQAQTEQPDMTEGP